MVQYGPDSTFCKCRVLCRAAAWQAGMIRPETASPEHQGHLLPPDTAPAAFTSPSNPTSRAASRHAGQVHYSSLSCSPKRGHVSLSANQGAGESPVRPEQKDTSLSKHKGVMHEVQHQQHHTTGSKSVVRQQTLSSEHAPDLHAIASSQYGCRPRAAR